MAEPKGPGTGQDATGVPSARPRPQTLDLSAKDVSTKPGSGPSATSAAPKPADAPKPVDAAKPAADSLKAAPSAASGSAAPGSAAKPQPSKVEPAKSEAAKPSGPGASASSPAAAPKPAAPGSAPAGPSSPAAKPADPAPKPAGSSTPSPVANARSAPPPQGRRSGVGTLGVIAAAIGGGAAIAAVALVAFGKTPLGGIAPDDGRVEAVEAKLETVARDVAALREQIAAAAQPADAGRIDARLAEIAATIESANGRVGGVETDLKALSDRVAQPPSPDPAVAALTGRIDALDLRLQSAATAETLNMLGGRIAGVEARTDALPTKAAVADIASRIETVGASIAGVGRKIDQATAPLSARMDTLAAALEARPKGDPAARLVVALGALDQALAAGRPFAAELTAAKAATDGGAAFAVLDASAAGGLPTRATLGADLAAIIGSLAPLTAPQPASVLDRFMANAGSIVKVAPQGAAPSGGDPGAARTRVASIAAAGDIEGALAARGTLDEAARAATDAWSQTATRRLAAETAVDGARTAALARLSAND